MKNYKHSVLVIATLLICELCFFLPDVKAQSNIYRTPRGKEYSKEIFMQQWAILNEFVQSFGNSKDAIVPTFRDYLLWMAEKWDIINKMPDTLKVEWLGWIHFLGEHNGIDPGFYQGNPPPAEYYRKDIEIGLREDGILVWRKVGKK